MTPLPPARRLLFLLAVTGGAALAAGPARAQYRVLETDDLRLVYHGVTLSFIAPHAARCYENAMRFHRGLFGYEPSEKVTVILDDSADFSNAAAWASPRNTVLMHVAPANFAYETGPANERINFTMNHELVHIVTLDQATGTDVLFRSLFRGKIHEVNEHPESILYGYLTMPRRAAPRWHREGAAVFLETWMAGGIGRAQGPYDEMVFRAMVRDGSHFYDPMGLESEGTQVDFQIGVNSYLYGTRFSSWLVHRYGTDPFLDWLSRRPQSRAYYANQFRHVFGRSLGSAWNEWVEWEHDFQQVNLDSIRRHPITPHRDLVGHALGSVSRACYDSVTRTLYAAVYHPGTVAHIAAIPLDGGPARFLREVKGPALYFVSSLAWDPDGRRLFYTEDNDEWRDLRVLDPATGSSRLLIRDARIGDLAWSRADSTLWAVRHFNGISSIVRLAPPYRDWTRAVSFPYGRDVYDLDVSSDGRRVAASMAEISGRQSLRLMDTDRLMRGDTTSRTLFDFGAAIPTSFVFSPDGRRLYGSSYYTGVSNIFRYDLAADSMDVVTNCETGMFRPVPLGGDSLAVFRYSGEGFVPALIAARPLTDVSAITYLGQRLVEERPELKHWQVPSPATVKLDSMVRREGPYRPLAFFRLVSAYPIVQGYKVYASTGVTLEFQDPLSLHTASVSASWSPQEGVPADERLHATVAWRGHGLAAKLRYNPASFYDLVGPTRTSRKGWGAGLEWTRTLVRDLPRTLELEARVDGWTGLERLPDAQNVATSAGFERLVSAGLQLTDENLRSSIGAVDHEKGWKWTLALGSNLVRFERPGGGTWESFPSIDGGVDLGTPLPLRHSSLWLRTAAGYSPGDRDEPFANFFFGGFGNNWVDYQDPKRYRHAWSLPGAEINSVAGTEFARATLDWNLPPVRFERLGMPAFHGRWLRLSLFGGGLVTNPGDPATRRELAHAGAQADLRLALLAHQPLTFSLGWGRAFERGERAGEEWMASLKIL